ncbi:hypothetical protein ASD11_09605 [Aeromicrobium sp. Root495]|uniref:hypothetical protein n=1 Tax=Aeromicrobium sp. Root495 TaxID=1736550 RepID=UPI00070061D0|nr:hypothetical protein [Aeromicrobium sp. Root495]KQY59782.1 hypothetical protein ASD11_09605 [Aeromicrobium sp. Root495]RYJ06940.1 MAG: hypothetical protein EON52_03795 [Actinomycetales bacterium]
MNDLQSISIEATPGWRVQVFEVSSPDHQAMVVRALHDELDIVTATCATSGSTSFVVVETRDVDEEAWAVADVVQAVDERSVRTHVSNAQPMPVPARVAA